MALPLASSRKVNRTEAITVICFHRVAVYTDIKYLFPSNWQPYRRLFERTQNSRPLCDPKVEEKREKGVYLTASVHRDQIGSSSDVQTKLEESMLPQCQFPLPRGLLQDEHAIFLAYRSSTFLAPGLVAQRSLRVSLAAFSGTVLGPRHDILSSAANQW